MSVIFMRKLPEDMICQPEKCISLDNTVAQLHVPTSRSIRTIRETLLRPVSIQLLYVVAHLYACQGAYAGRGPICE